MGRMAGLGGALMKLVVLGGGLFGYVGRVVFGM